MPLLLDDVMPRWDFNEVHTVNVQANPDRIYRAIKEIHPDDVPVAGMLMQVRSLPSRLLGRNENEGPPVRGDEPLLTRMLDGPFVFLTEAPDQELVFGAIGKFWKVGGSPFLPIANAKEFLDFDRPGFGKLVTNFLVGPSDALGRHQVSTETRISVPDAAARRRFAVYWLAVRPGSGLIRRVWLNAIKRQAEAPS